LDHRSAAALLGILICSRGSFATAHDFWLQPSDYWIAPDALTSLTLQVGHGPFRQRSPITARRITRFQAISSKGTAVDLQEHLQLGQPLEDGDFWLKTPGVYVLVLPTDDRAQSHLPSIRFNDYLKVEGLAPALEQRMRCGGWTRMVRNAIADAPNLSGKLALLAWERRVR
jgi:hypothetical protein